DAAVVNELAGLEVELSSAHAFTIEPAERKCSLTLSLSMSPVTMQALALELVDACGWPAFTEPEWREIARVLRCGGERTAAQLEFAQRIDCAYNIPEQPLVEVERAQARLDAHVLDSIVALMSGVEWSSDTPAEVATLVRMSGRDILDSGA